MTRKPSGVLAALALALVALPAAAAELTVSVAASMTNAFTELGKAYEAAHPDTKLVFNYAASGPLLAQIVQGAPVDLFVSADAETMDKAEAGGHIDKATRVNIAGNTLVLIVPATATQAPVTLAGLAAPAVQRIALGNPASVPNGRYAKAALEAAGLWDALQAKYVYAENVRQSLSYVTRAEVEAGFVFSTDAALETGKVRVAFPVPVAKPIVYPMAIVTGSQEKVAAAAFIHYVQSPDGQAVFARYGFTRP